MEIISILMVTVVIVGVIITYWSLLSGGLRGLRPRNMILAGMVGLLLTGLIGAFFYLILSIVFAGPINAGSLLGMFFGITLILATIRTFSR